MVVNRDQQNSHTLQVSFRDETTDETRSFAGPVEIATFGSAQYQWHPAKTRFEAHAEHPTEWPVVAYFPGNADPDGPIAHTQQTATAGTSYAVPAASVMVIRGKILAAPTQ
jgi:hypothetical protein